MEWHYCWTNSLYFQGRALLLNCIVLYLFFCFPLSLALSHQYRIILFIQHKWTQTWWNSSTPKVQQTILAKEKKKFMIEILLAKPVSQWELYICCSRCYVWSCYFLDLYHFAFIPLLHTIYAHIKRLYSLHWKHPTLDIRERRQIISHWQAGRHSYIRVQNVPEDIRFRTPVETSELCSTSSIKENIPRSYHKNGRGDGNRNDSKRVNPDLWTYETFLIGPMRSDSAMHS